MAIRFLKANCRQDDGTYILRQSTDGEALHLYDLGLASSSKQKHFKWMLAMLSYRFAIRLGHHIKIATVRCRVQIRQRQMHLFTRYYFTLFYLTELQCGLISSSNLYSFLQCAVLCFAFHFYPSSLFFISVLHFCSSFLFFNSVLHFFSSSLFFISVLHFYSSFLFFISILHFCLL